MTHTCPSLAVIASVVAVENVEADSEMEQMGSAAVVVAMCSLAEETELEGPTWEYILCSWLSSHLWQLAKN